MSSNVAVFLDRDGTVNEEINYLGDFWLFKLLPWFGDYLKDCRCRKPRTGLLLQAARDLNIALRKSFMVGAKMFDIQVGYAVGCKTVPVLTGYGKEEAVNEIDLNPDCNTGDLPTAAEWILKKKGNQLCRILP